ncbi:outer membrane autotransporter barrel domain-containing protein [Herbaspirillum sp. CF444]|nr:outer membrane autotransporter barrel domain-containing protein [Herbaspirillum sp. CF444]
MQAVNQLAVGLSGQWTLTGSSTLIDLNNRGWIDLNGAPGALHTLTVNSLAGDGVFGMSTDFSTSSSDKLVVTGANQANGNFALNIKGQGVDPKKSGSITVVETQGGSANFELAYGAADLGTYQYVLKQDGNNWVLVPTTKTTPFADSVLAITGVAPTIWYSQLIPLRTRLGELRFQQDNGGGWARAYGSKLNISSSAGTPYSQRQSGLAVGADKAFQTLDGKVFIGGVFNASRSDLDDHAGANGSVDAYSIGVYGAWLNQHGYYLSGLLNYNHYSSKAQAVGSGGSSAHGSFATNGVGFSVEGGRKFELNNGFFLEPYAQVAGLRMQSVDVTMSNGMMAHGDHTSSLQGALGATLGNTFRSIAGNVVEPYVRLAEVNEFAKGADISINGNTFHNNLSGSRTELGLGVAAQIGKSLSANVDYTYAKGGRLSQPFMLNAGLRYEW